MTSIEFIFHELWETPKDKLTWHTILTKALEMHKQEIIDAHYCGQIEFESIMMFNEHEGPMSDESIDYYNRNFNQ